MAFIPRTPGGPGDSGIKKVFATGLTDTASTDKEGIGTIRIEGNSWYKWILYTSTVTAIANQLVVYHGDDGYDDHEVSMDYSDGIVAAGVLMAIIATTEYGWIQIKGGVISTLAIETSNDGTPVAAADADPVCLGDADGAFRRVDTLHDNDAGLELVLGVTIDASLKKILLTGLPT